MLSPSRLQQHLTPSQHTCWHCYQAACMATASCDVAVLSHQKIMGYYSNLQSRVTGLCPHNSLSRNVSSRPSSHRLVWCCRLVQDCTPDVRAVPAADHNREGCHRQQHVETHLRKDPNCLKAFSLQQHHRRWCCGTVVQDCSPDVLAVPAAYYNRKRAAIDNNMCGRSVEGTPTASAPSPCRFDQKITLVLQACSRLLVRCTFCSSSRPP